MANPRGRVLVGPLQGWAAALYFIVDLIPELKGSGVLDRLSDLSLAGDHDWTDREDANGAAEAAFRGPDMEECPACAEIIKTQALACRYCGYHFLNGGSPVEISKDEVDSMIDTSNAVESKEKLDVPVVKNSIGLVEYRGFFIAEMDSGKYQILSENGEKLKKSGDYDSSEYAMATLDYFITIAVELMSYPASLPRTN